MSVDIAFLSGSLGVLVSTITVGAGMSIAAYFVGSMITGFVDFISALFSK